jgi:protein TonB
MDYLARYGPEGAFSEVAELRLNQLTGPDGARAPAQRPAVRPPAPAPRAEAPRRAEPPPRRPDALPPTQRRADVAPTRRPPADRDYTRELRDPPKGEGGALRAFVLIALLGGAALAGGLYFGGGLGNPAPAAPQAVETTPASTSEPLGSEFGELEDAPSVPLSQAVTTRPDRQAASREREATPPRTVEREQPRQTPPPTTQPTSAASTGGPVSLSPNANQGGSTIVVPIGPPPETQPLQTANVEPQITGPSSSVRAPAGSVVWTQRPSQRRIAELYPPRALSSGVGGRVVLDCQVLGNLSVTCSVASETPAGVGFGRAALGASNAYRARATLSDGSSAVGSSTRIAVNFQASQ